MMDARRPWTTTALALVAMISAPAAADDPADAHALLQAMHAAVLAGEDEQAIALGKQVKKTLLASAEPVPSHVQGGLVMVQGAAMWSLGDQDAAMDAWRAALRVAPALSWDATLPSEGDADAVFEALRREVDGRPRTVVGVPADLGATRLYVAGQPATPDLALPEGSYLVQAACPDGVLRSRWWKTTKPLKAEKSCPGGLGEAMAVADDACSGPGFDAFGNPRDPCAEVAQGE
jgi:hypothetical protein